MDNGRDFKGVWIPKEIWLDTRLSIIDKFVLVEIDSLDNEKGCFASNKYLAEFCHCSEWTVSNSIKKLTELNYIEKVTFNGRQRKLQSRLGKITEQTWEIPKADLGKSHNINIDNNIDNNIDDNTPYNPPKGDCEKKAKKYYDKENFDKFWKNYPKKKDKAKTEKWFEKNNPNEELMKIILESLDKFKRTKDWQKDNGQYIPLPTTWLNGKRWEDEISENDIEMTDEEETRMLEEEFERRRRERDTGRNQEGY